MGDLCRICQHFLLRHSKTSKRAFTKNCKAIFVHLQLNFYNVLIANLTLRQLKHKPTNVEQIALKWQAEDYNAMEALA